MIAAIGASGAVIASGVTTFVLLVGIVSFDVWPMSDAAGPGSGTDLRLVELPPEPAAEAPAAAVPFGSGVLVTEPATIALADDPAASPERPKLAGKPDIGSGDAPPTPVAQVPGGGGEETPGDGDGEAVGVAEEPAPVEQPIDDEADQDDENGRPQRPARPAPAPAPAPEPATSGTATAPDGSGSSSGGGGAGGSGSGGNGNHGGQG